MIVRVLGLILACVASGMLVATLRYRNAPWRYWSASATLTFIVTLLYYRIRLLTLRAPVSVGDVGFVVANALVIAGCVVFLREVSDGRD